MTPRKTLILASFALMSGCATAGSGAFAGSFEGTGRECRGDLLVGKDTIKWHTPFAECAASHYTILSQVSDGNRPEIVFLLQGGPTCDFAVISLDQDPAYPGYWNATGFRSESDYRKGSDDTLVCNLTKRSP